jgi:ubiquinone/menaquinone biosynthesis C-methylase UbiE
MNERAELVAHYSAADERGRLIAAESLELLRTQVILDRVLPMTPSAIIDVGGGAGVYASWLADRGHSVHLVDPVPKHVEQAAAVGTFTAALGDAVALDADDDSYDAVLLLGPLYHLVDRADRLRALREARRVARAGSPVAVAAISRYASTMDGFYHGLIADSAFVEILTEDLRTGQHRNREDDPRYFTTAYFHTCAGLRDEMTEAGFDDVDVLPVEGLLAWSPDLAGSLADPGVRDLVLRCLERIETDPAATAASPHLLAVARVPG